jgi:hypothetical protein
MSGVTGDHNALLPALARPTPIRAGRSGQPSSRLPLAGAALAVAVLLAIFYAGLARQSGGGQGGVNAVGAAVVDSGGRLPVVFGGVAPGIFAEQIDVVVEGRYTPEGVFHATTLLTKCPSRFEV